MLNQHNLTANIQDTVSEAQISEPETARLWRWALILSIITIVYNLGEGLISTAFGFHDETLALFGFGADSFIEVISGIGIVHLVLRLRRNPQAQRDAFEATALRVTGVSFYLLVGVLGITSLLNLYTGHTPDSTFWGLLVSSTSILSMYALIRAKTYVGRALDSQAILADADCTRACLMMSFLLLISSGIFALTGFAYVDSLGALGILYFAWKEGQSCFAQARSKEAACCGCGP